MPVHADDRLDRRPVIPTANALARGQSVRHEEDRVPVVLAAGMRLGQVRLGLLDEVVLVLTAYRFAAGAVQVSLHIFTFA